jgi:Ca-activated chloride channel family protein
MRKFGLLLLMIIAVGVLALPAQEQEPFTVKVDVALVTVDVVVTDATGRPVTTLTKDDFEVYEDGKLQEIRSFEPVDSAYGVLLLFDCSTSTQPLWPFLMESMNRFTARLRPQDTVAVAQFGGSYKTLLDWKPRGSGGMAIQIQPDDRSCNNTLFYEAISRALTELRKPFGRKGAVVLTDGVHNGIPIQRTGSNGGVPRRVNAEDDSGFQKVLRQVKASDVVLYFVAVNTDLNPAGLTGTRGKYNPDDIYDTMQVRARMELLAEVSGGKIVYPKQPGDVVPLFEQIGRELGTSYGLGYPPPGSGGNGTYRKIEVRVRDKTLQVHQSRVGYEAR